MSCGSDESLMALVAEGDCAAFEQLVVRHQQAVWRTTYRMVGDVQAAEDLAQEAFLRIFRAADRYQATSTFRTYLYRVVVHLCVDYLRKGRPEPAADLSHLTAPTASADDQAETGERRHAVQQAIASLPPKQRSAVVLRYYESLSTREIAEVMETTAKAIERHLARGRAALEVRLARLMDDR